MSSSTGRLIEETAVRLFTAHVNREVLDAVAEGEWPTALWEAAQEAGLTTAAAAAVVAGAGAGAGIDEDWVLADIYALLRTAGRHSLPLPLAESLLATQMLAESGVEQPSASSVTGLALAHPADSLRWDGQKLSGTLSQVAFGRHLDGLVIGLNDAAAGGGVLRLWAPQLPEPQVAITPAMNAAGEPCDQLDFKDVQAEVLTTTQTPMMEMLALSRALLMAGAMESALQLAVEYALERVQFGRPIASFQAIQQQLAVAAAEVAAATCAAEGALEHIGTPQLAVAVATAKARVGEAVAPVSSIVHQVHGAMGFTYEHILHYRTRRLWVWRDEYGHEAYWQARLGRHVAGLGAEQCWPFIVEPTPMSLS